MYDQYLKILEMTEYSSLEEIKYSYRILSKKYHPDLNKECSAELFIKITEAYEYLLKHHKPKSKPKEISKDAEKFFRVLDNSFVISLPVKSILDNDIVIYCMLDFKEFRISLSKGSEIPKEIKITNINTQPLTLLIKRDKYV